MGRVETRGVRRSFGPLRVSSRSIGWVLAVAGLLAASSVAGCGGEVADPGARAGGAVEVPVARTLAEGGSREWPALQVQVLDVVRVAAHVIEVRLALVNRAPDRPFDLGDRFAATAAEAGSVSGMFLTDTAGNVRYFVLRTVDGRPLCSTGLAPLGPGERREVWARFALPPEPVTKVRVNVPHVSLPGDLTVPEPAAGG